MNTKKTVQHEFTVADLRAFAEERGYFLPDEFSVQFTNIKHVLTNTGNNTPLIWIEYTEA